MRSRSLMMVLGVSLLSGCSLMPKVPDFIGDLPQHFGFDASPREVKSPTATAAWWKTLQDPLLNQLVAEALKDNPDAEIALQRLQEARVYESVVAGAAEPQVGVEAGGGRGTGSDLSRGRAASPLQSGDSSVGLKEIAYVGGADISWSLDLFGLHRAEIKAARADRAAAEAARQSVLVAVVADTVRTYVTLRGLQFQAAALKKNIDTQEKLRVLIQSRYEMGLINALEPYSAERQVMALRALKAPLDAEISKNLHALSILIGALPNDTNGLKALEAPPGSLLMVPKEIHPGLPIDVLRQRPDVRLAEASLAGAAARAGIANARLMPTVLVSGGLGIEGQSFFADDDKRRHIWSLGAQGYWSILDFGVLDGLSEIADFEVQARGADYRRVVIRAVNEVDSSIDAFYGESGRMQSLERALGDSEQALTIARQRYERGLTDFLVVLDAERQQYQIESDYIQARSLALIQYGQAIKALGGGFDDAPEVPAIREPDPAVIAAFKRLSQTSSTAP